MRAVFDGLGDETWRQYVDLDSQEHGPLAYDRGLGKGAREPGYLASMALAHRRVRGELGRRLTVASFEAIHRATLAHAPPAETYRAGVAWVGIHRDRIERGVEALWAEHGATPEEGEDGRLRLRFGVRDPRAMAALLEAGIDRLYRALDAARDARERVRAIATFHQSLELWHPTRDGNTRRHTLILVKLLVEHGETPTIMTEINDAYVRLPSSWTRMVVQGMNRWRVVRDALAHGEDVEERMHAFDREGAIGRRGARWLRPNRTSFADWEHVSFVDAYGVETVETVTDEQLSDVPE
jgi:hypothetical protein